MATHERSDSEERERVHSSKTKPNDGRGATGKKKVMIPTGIMPFVDIHMHIQSLNCTPMPLSWSTPYIKSNLAARELAVLGLFIQELKGTSRKEINEKSTSWLIKKMVVHDFGQIGQLDTQGIANIYRAEIVLNELLADLHWMTDMKEKEVRSDLKKAAQELCIYNLTNDRKKAYKKFLKDTHYYFRGNEDFHMSVCLPMDLAYSHFWGRFGLPIQLTDEKNNSFYYFEEFIKVVIDRKYYGGIEGYYIGYDAIDYDPRQGPPETQIMDYDFDLKKYCDDFFDYLDFAAENDSGLIRYPEKDIDAFILFEDTPGEIEDIMRQIKRKDKLPEEEQGSSIKAIKTRIQNLRNKFYAICAPEGKKQKPYLHFLGTVPGKDGSKYEAYDKQLFHHEIAAMRYPYKMLPFYHYDPRRHLAKVTASAPAPKNIQKVAAGESLLTFAERHAHIHGISDTRVAAEAIWNHPGNKKFHKHTWHHPDRAGTRLPRQIYIGDGKYETFAADKIYKKKWEWIIIHPGEEFSIPVAPPGSSGNKDKTKAVAKKVKDLVENHAFFHFDSFMTKEIGKDSFMISKFRNMMSYYKILRLKPAAEINAAYLQKELESSMTLNDEVFAKMVHNPDAARGIFWGIKMYSELGYEPGDFKTYPHLEEFYAFCESNQVPITVHCSHHGMLIGDTHLYKKHVFNSKGWSEKKEWDLLETIDWVDATCVAPKKLYLTNQKKIMMDAYDNSGWAYCWEEGDIEEKFHEKHWGKNFSEYESYDPQTWDKVLKKYPNLKLNLAHFSGFSCMVKKPGSFDWRDEIGELIQEKNYKYVYTDISNLLSDVDGVPNMITEIPEVFTTAERNYIKEVYNYEGDRRTGYYILRNVNADILRKLEYIYRKHDLIKDDIKTLAEELKRLLEKYPNLKERLMVGTDWYMGETTKFSPGLNFARIFYLMRALTKEIGETYDCWYQFAVINTFRFLGLLDQDAVPDNSPLTTELLERYKVRMEGVLGDSDWRDDSSIKKQKDLDKIKHELKTNLDKLKQLRIKKSDEIKKDGKILITT